MPLSMSLHIEEWATRVPFRITGLSRSVFRLVAVELTDGKHVGRSEALPVHYLKETVESLYAQLEAAGSHLKQGITREELLVLMPAGGARKAVDCALWDLEAQRQGRSVWAITGIEPKPVVTAYTIGIEDTAEEMAARALEAAEYPILKIKTNDDEPVARVRAIRAARPDARLVVDANQGWSFEQLVEITPQLADLGVELIEQPLRRGCDEALDGYRSLVPICADESCQHRGELDAAARRYQIINIKLDKAGGLTEALLLARAVRERGLKLLVSNMGGTSLSMAPAFVLAQLCDYVELDGPLLLKHDRFPSLSCRNGVIDLPHSHLWAEFHAR